MADAFESDLGAVELSEADDEADDGAELADVHPLALVVHPDQNLRRKREGSGGASGTMTSYYSVTTYITVICYKNVPSSPASTNRLLTH